MSGGGKGSSPRPFGIGRNEYSKRWDAIFKRDAPEGPKVCQRCGKVLSTNPDDIHTCTPKEYHNA